MKPLKLTAPSVCNKQAGTKQSKATYKAHKGNFLISKRFVIEIKVKVQVVFVFCVSESSGQTVEREIEKETYWI